MRHLVLVFSFWLFWTGNIEAQIVRVVDKAQHESIEHVYIYDKEQTHSVVTNNNGEADLSGFESHSTLILQHPSYNRRVIPFRRLKEKGFHVTMEERSLKMREIYVSATKRKEQQSEIPRQVLNIGEEQIDLYNPQTSADLLESRGKVFVQKSQLGGGSPMLRGFAANSVLLAMDGIRINNAIFRSGNLQNVLNVDPNIVERSEVILGPGSIIYGSDALGGVMNFQMKEPELSYGEEPVVGGTAMMRYSSANNENTIHLDLNYGREKWGFFSSVTYSRFGSLRTGSDFDKVYGDWGKRLNYVVRDQERETDLVVPNQDVTLQRPSGYKQLHVMEKVTYRPMARLNLTYTGYLSTTSDIPRYDRLIKYDDNGKPKNAEWYYGPQQWMTHYLDASYNRTTSLFDRIRLKAGYQYYEESRNDREFRDPWLRNRTEQLDIFTANLDFDRYLGSDTEIYYGIEYIYNFVHSNAHKLNIETGDVEPTGTRYPDGGSDYMQWAGYVKYKRVLNERWTLIFGGRYSQVFLKSRFESKQFYDFPFDEITVNTGALNGSAGMTFRPTESLQFNLNASSGFRAPNVDDVAKVFDSEPGNVVVPNPDVSPEYTYNLDLGVIKRVPDRLRVELNGYYTWLRDAMVRRKGTFNGRDSIMYDGALSRVEKVVNAGKAYIYGFSGSVEVDLSDHVSAYSNLTYTEGMDQTENIPMRHVPPTHGQTGMVYTTDELRAEFFVRYNAAKPIEDFSPSERNKPHMYTNDGTPGWYTLNINTSYQVNNHFSVDIGAENLLDEHYRPYSSGISAPGRHVDVTIRADM